MSTVSHIQLIDGDPMPDYPLGSDDQLAGHYFMAWHHREWLNSEMRLKATEECRALYFDLICISQDQKPVGTLPDDMEQLAKLLMVQEKRLELLCSMPFGPLHKWEKCNCDGKVRLMHHRVLDMALKAVAGKQANRARNEAVNASKRRERLRATVTGMHAELGKNDAAILWMDDWIQKQGCTYRSSDWIERSMQAWSNHMFDLSGRGGS